MRYILSILAALIVLKADILLPETFEANFTQTVVNELNSTVVYKGNLKIAKEQKALWIYDSPFQKKIYIVKEEFLIIEDEIEQAIYGKNQNAVDIYKIFETAVKLSLGRYKAVCCDKEYIVRTKNDKISNISYKDKLGNRVDIEFENVVYDAPIDDKVFRAKIPKEYDLIRR